MKPKFQLSEKQLLNLVEKEEGCDSFEVGLPSSFKYKLSIPKEFTWKELEEARWDYMKEIIRAMRVPKALLGSTCSSTIEEKSYSETRRK